MVSHEFAQTLIERLKLKHTIKKICSRWWGRRFDCPHLAGHPAARLGHRRRHYLVHAPGEAALLPKSPGRKKSFWTWKFVKGTVCITIFILYRLQEFYSNCTLKNWTDCELQNKFKSRHLQTRVTRSLKCFKEYSSLASIALEESQFLLLWCYSEFPGIIMQVGTFV